MKSHLSAKYTGLIVLALCLSAFKANAHVPSDGHIHVTAGPFLFATHELRHQFSSPLMNSGGLIVEGDVDKNGGIEISMFYLDKRYNVRKDGMSITEQGKRMYISMGYRHWFNKDWSAGLGFFSSYSMGDPRAVRDDFAPASPPKTSASKPTEYGFDFSAQHEFLQKGRWSAILDLRYAWSVTPKGDEDANHFGVMFGVKYFVQAADRDLDKVR
jgi:hypothetical protein